MPTAWPPISYGRWAQTCDTLHAHTQVLGKLAVALAPPEPELQHAALRLTARGWETLPLPAPDGSGAFVAALDLGAHEAIAEHSDGRRARVPLTPNRAVADVTRDLLGAIDAMAGVVEISTAPQEVPWTTPLDEDREHATYDAAQVADYFTAATFAAGVLAAYRAPFRGRSTPVNAWWGSFDLSVSVFSGRPADPPSADFIMRNSMDAEEVAVGWWPGDASHDGAAFYAYAHPGATGLSDGRVSPGRWDEELGEFLLDWDDVIAADDPRAYALTFLRAALLHACAVCEWDPALAASADGHTPPVR
jgi:Family of unknown function (DUF5996)